MKTTYSETELRRHVNREQAELIVERRALVKRLNEIDDRLGELEKASNILDGGLR